MIVTETIGAGGVAIEAPPAVWATMSSVLLGTWERRPLIASPKDRDKIFDNSAAFVRACYPAQASFFFLLFSVARIGMGREQGAFWCLGVLFW